MAKNGIPTHGDMVAHGFTQVQDTDTLYRHANLPDFVFKRVGSEAAAVACGGTLVFRDGTVSDAINGLMLFGDSAVVAYNARQTGSLAVPTRLYASATSPTPRLVRNPKGIAGGTCGAQALDTCWTLHTAQHHEPDFLANAPYTFLVGVVSKAIDGVAVRNTADVSFESSGDPLHPQYFNHLTGSVGAIGLGLRSLQAHHRINVLISRGGRWNGFIDAPITIDARALIAANRAAYLGVIEGDEIKERYAQAFDAELALGKPMSSVQQARLWFTGEGGLTGRTPVIGTTRTGLYGAMVENSSVLMVLAPYTDEWVTRYDTSIANGGPIDAVTISLPNPADRAQEGVRTPCLFTRIVANDGWPTIDHIALDGYSSDELRVPFKVNLNGTLTDAGAVFGMVSPALRRVESTEHLDFLGQIEADMDRVRAVEIGYAQPLAIDAGTPEANRIAAVESGLEAERMRRAAVDRLKPSLRPVVAAIVDFANRVDERVADDIKD